MSTSSVLARSICSVRLSPSTHIDGHGCSRLHLTSLVTNAKGSGGAGSEVDGPGEATAGLVGLGDQGVGLACGVTFGVRRNVDWRSRILPCDCSWETLCESRGSVDSQGSLHAGGEEGCSSTAEEGVDALGSHCIYA